MGFNLKFVAVTSAEQQRLLDHLGLEVGAEVSHEFADDYTCTTLTGGWFVVVAERDGLDLDEALVAASSPAGFAVGCEMVEVVMFSEARGFRDGVLDWSVTYDPDKTRSDVMVAGAPPSPFAEIRSRLVEENLAHRGEQVDYVFDVPVELVASISGFMPGTDNGETWKALRRKGAHPKSVSEGQKPLYARIESELLPVLSSLGWEFSENPQREYRQNVYRQCNGRTQHIWFDFKDTILPYIIVHFVERDPDEQVWPIYGRVADPQVRPSIWRRFSWRRFVELAAPQPPSADPVGDVVSRAREHIKIADAYLKTGELDPRIHVGV